jgi:hypothetical protein
MFSLECRAKKGFGTNMAAMVSPSCPEVEVLAKTRENTGEQE